MPGRRGVSHLRRRAPAGSIDAGFESGQPVGIGVHDPSSKDRVHRHQSVTPPTRRRPITNEITVIDSAPVPAASWCPTARAQSGGRPATAVLTALGLRATPCPSRSTTRRAGRPGRGPQSTARCRPAPKDTVDADAGVARQPSSSMPDLTGQFWSRRRAQPCDCAGLDRACCIKGANVDNSGQRTNAVRDQSIRAGHRESLAEPRSPSTSPPDARAVRPGGSRAHRVGDLAFQLADPGPRSGAAPQ